MKGRQDHNSLVSGLINYFEAEGFEIRVAMNGEQALKSVKSAPPDIILLDIQMPKIDGYEVCRELKQDENFNFIPVIFISAMTESFC